MVYVILILFIYVNVNRYFLMEPSRINRLFELIFFPGSLSVLGPEDGRQQLVSIARQLGSEVANQQLPCTGITVSYTDELIRGLNFVL